MEEYVSANFNEVLYDLIGEDFEDLDYYTALLRLEYIFNRT